MAAMETSYVFRGWVEMKDSGSRSAGVIPGVETRKTTPMGYFECFESPVRKRLHG